MAKYFTYLKNKDIDLLFFFNHRIHRNILDRLMKIVTHLGSFLFAVAFPLILLLTRNADLMVIGKHLIVGLFISSSLVFLIKKTIRRPRPFEIFEDIKTFLIPRDKNSFPSGHTCAAMTMGMIVSQSISTLASTLVIGLSVLVGISRMYLGVHYPSDVIFGGAIAIVTVSILIPIIL